MLSRLTPKHYLSPEIFAREQQNIFRKLWLFACFRTALAEPGAFVTRSMAGLPVLLRNCDGEIRAFENQCPHRQMALHIEPFGQARMVCPYHGWVFAEDGKVKTIPHESTLYAYSAQEREALCLRRYSVAVIGNLVFVNLDTDPLPLERQFTPEFQAALADISSHFGALSVHSDTRVRYNWKLNHENVMDGNHIAYVHPKTFQPFLRAGELAAKKQDTASMPEPAAEPLATERTLSAQSGWTRTPMQIAPAAWHADMERYGFGGGDGDCEGEEGDADYFHTFTVYPNVNFISPGGLSFIAQQFEPVAPGETQLRMTLTLARERRRMPGLPALLRAYLKGETAVVREDIVALEALQAGLHEGSRPARHGRYEDRLQAHADVYLDMLEGHLP